MTQNARDCIHLDCRGYELNMCLIRLAGIDIHIAYQYTIRPLKLMCTLDSSLSGVRLLAFLTPCSPRF